MYAELLQQGAGKQEPAPRGNLLNRTAHRGEREGSMGNDRKKVKSNDAARNTKSDAAGASTSSPEKQLTRNKAASTRTSQQPQVPSSVPLAPAVVEGRDYTAAPSVDHVVVPPSIHESDVRFTTSANLLRMKEVIAAKADQIRSVAEGDDFLALEDEEGALRRHAQLQVGPEDQLLQRLREQKLTGREQVEAAHVDSASASKTNSFQQQRERILEKQLSP
ncbi:unnamed protein product, partial [Amoebophrya sp. A120]|eukprot:GSA120T00014564001.1